MFVLTLCWVYGVLPPLVLQNVNMKAIVPSLSDWWLMKHFCLLHYSPPWYSISVWFCLFVCFQLSITTLCLLHNSISSYVDCNWSSIYSTHLAIMNESQFNWSVSLNIPECQKQSGSNPLTNFLTAKLQLHFSSTTVFLHLCCTLLWSPSHASDLFTYLTLFVLRITIWHILPFSG